VTVEVVARGLLGVALALAGDPGAEEPVEEEDRETSADDPAPPSS
jgi:hypothetical protein